VNIFVINNGNIIIGDVIGIIIENIIENITGNIPRNVVGNIVGNIEIGFSTITMQQTITLF
jgi:hypothetical protein